MTRIPVGLFALAVAAAGCTTPQQRDVGVDAFDLDAPAVDAPSPADVPRRDGPEPDVGCGSCDDSNPCTTDTCGPGGCIHTANDMLPYDDGNVCTTGDRCSGGTAVTDPLDCSDGVTCTRDTCDGSTGCVHTPEDGACTASPGGRCDPGFGCQYGSACSPSMCVAGPCETARCMGDTCVRTPLCRGSDLCCGGYCCPEDANPCTDVACGDGGSCVALPHAGACDDGNPCTVGDTCSGTSCASGAAVVCNDGNVCTIDACDPDLGCQSTAMPGMDCGSDSTSCITRICNGAGTCVTSTCAVGNVCCGGTCLIPAAC